MKTFINPSTGEKVTAQNKADEKRMSACCWKVVKTVKTVFSNGKTTGQRFI